MPEVDTDQFRAAVAPSLDAVRHLARSVLDLSPRHGYLPSPDALGMAELNEQSLQFAAIDGWPEPVADAHSFGAVTLVAAADYAHAFADLFDSEEIPLFAHLVLARASLEACVVSAWLNEAPIPVEARAKRALAEHLYSAKEQTRLPVGAAHAKQNLAFWKSVASRLGYSVTWVYGKPKVEDQLRWSVPSGINRLMTDDTALHIGKIQWGYLSAVAHVTWHGLQPAISRSTNKPRLGPVLADLTLKSTAVHLQAACLLRALRAAGTARATLMGWSDEQWQRTCAGSQRAETIAVASADPDRVG
jgi:hypothetical protein